MVPPDELRKKREAQGKTTPPLLKRAGTGTGSYTDKLIQARQTQILDADAKRSLSSRFLEELGINLKNIGQGTARSIGVTGATILSPLTNASRGEGFKFSEPTVDASSSPFWSAIFGKEPFSLRSETEQLMETFGASEETKNKYALPLGLSLGVLDLYPGTPKKAFLKSASRSIAATSNVDAILKTLRAGLKGSDNELSSLAKQLKNVNDPAKVESIISKSIRATEKTASESKPWVDKVSGKLVGQMPLDEYIKNNLKGIGAQRRGNLSILKTLHAREVRKVAEATRKPTSAIREAGASLVRQAGKAASPSTLKSEIRAFVKESRQTAMRLSKELSGARRIADREARRSGKEATKLGKAQIKAQGTTLKTEIRGARGIIKQETSKAIRETEALVKARTTAFQSQVVDLIRKNLPMALRGSLLKTVTRANTPKQLLRSVSHVEDAIEKYKKAKSASKELRTRRSKLNFLQKVAELNATAMKDMKNRLNLNKPISKMDKLELDRLIEEAMRRFHFKKEKGLVEFKTMVDGKLVDAPKKPRPSRLTEQQKIANREAVRGSRSFTNRVANKIKNAKEAFTTPDIIQVPSEALRGVGAETVLTALRHMGFRARKFANDGSKEVDSIIKAFGIDRVLRKRIISDDDLIDLDLAMKNGAVEEVLDIARRYGVEKEFIKLREVLDGVYKRAQDVGLDFDYRKGYFPRAFKNDAVSRKAVEDILNREHGDLLAEAFSNFAKKMGRQADPEERWKIINNLMRGFKQEGVTLSKTGAMKRRMLDEVTPELAPYYQDSFSALQGYFESANNLIEARRFFGKHLGVDMKKIPAEANLADIAGNLVDDLLVKGTIKPEAVGRIKEVLQARFRGGAMNPFLQGWKDLSYLTIMGDVLSAVTQIGDLEKVFYRAGMRHAFPAVFKSLFGRTAKSGVSLADLHLTKTVAEEMNSPSAMGRVVNQIFRNVGLSWVDRLGKDAFLSGTLSKYENAVKSGDEQFLAQARRILGDKADETFDDIAKGNATENVRFLLLNELADFFPVTLEEVPMSYLKHPNGRIFYVMKTYTTKQLNTYRRELYETAKTDPVGAFKNTVRLVGYLVLMNATADEIKEFIKGDDTSVSDKVVNNMLKVFGFNRYSLDRTQQQGVGRTIVEQVLPPTTLLDDASKDFMDVFSDDGLGAARSTRNIPVGGELYYWWFGRGRENLEKKSGKSTSGSSGWTSSASSPSASGWTSGSSKSSGTSGWTSK